MTPSSCPTPTGSSSNITWDPATQTGSLPTSLSLKPSTTPNEVTAAIISNDFSFMTELGPYLTNIHPLMTRTPSLSHSVHTSQHTMTTGRHPPTDTAQPQTGGVTHWQTSTSYTEQSPLCHIPTYQLWYTWTPSWAFVARSWPHKLLNSSTMWPTSLLDHKESP